MRAGARAYRGVALAALGIITAVTVGWWALALYPVGAGAPAWVERTRLACFGASPNGLPNAGGWLLLIGEPLGMLGFLLFGWGRALISDLTEVLASRSGRMVLVVVVGMLAWGSARAVTVVHRALGASDDRFVVNDRARSRGTQMATVPPLSLLDQRGAPFELRQLAGTPVLVTFAYAHCETVCPTVVQDVLRARRDARRADIPLVIVTVDPWRDVPARLGSMAEHWGLGSTDRVLSGTVEQVASALDAWNVGRSRDEQTGDIAHQVVVVLVRADGRTAIRFDGNSDRLLELLQRS